jgi:beta-glucanase (GH16 family)
MSFNPDSGGKIATAVDVALNNPANNQVLTYDGSTAKWKNAATTGGSGGSPVYTSTVATTRPQYPTPGTGSYQLVWSDTFTLPQGQSTAAVDASKWTHQTGTGAGYFNYGWGNQEIETYTTSQTNTQVTSQGLEIRAINQSATGYDGAGAWTSGKIVTKGKFACTYGKIEVEAKVPYGKGAWPAFWMLGDDFPQHQWPSCGEIDIMEIGKAGNFSNLHATLHGPGYAGEYGPTTMYTHSQLLSNAYHTYSVEWGPDSFKWLLDGVVYATILRANIPQPADWVFDHPFYLILNVAIGNGGFTGPLDVGTFQTGTFNGQTSAYATMIVKSVKVYQK